MATNPVIADRLLLSSTPQGTCSTPFINYGKMISRAGHGPSKWFRTQRAWAGS